MKNGFVFNLFFLSMNEPVYSIMTLTITIFFPTQKKINRMDIEQIAAEFEWRLSNDVLLVTLDFSFHLLHIMLGKVFDAGLFFHNSLGHSFRIHSLLFFEGALPYQNFLQRFVGTGFQLLKTNFPLCAQIQHLTR